MVIRPARWGDLEQVARLLGAQSRASSGIAAIRVEHVRREWELESFEVGGDHLVAERDGRIAGYAALSPVQALSLTAGEQGVADELLARISARARERGLTALVVTPSSDADPRSALVRRHPFELVSETILMWRALDGRLEEPIWPAGIEVRTFDPADAHSVHGLLDEAYGAWDRHYRPMPHDDWVRWMTRDAEFDPTVWWLAELDGGLAGCALHWSGGWLKDLAVREPYRGRGLGAALVRQGLVEFARRGLRRVGLRVDSTNPTGAVGLYERLGFVAARREGTWVLEL